MSKRKSSNSKNKIIRKKGITLKEILGNPINREESIALIRSQPDAYNKFQGFPVPYREQILEFIQGNRGLPILYDGFFKSVLDPLTKPERLTGFLSCLLKQNVTIVDVLPKEGMQLAELGSLVIMDIIVQITDGSYINVEIQKYGYEFPGERSSCYMSDLIMRQYNRIKARKKKGFSFKDMKPVYLIVLMEHSTQNFKAVYPSYIHRSQHSLDTRAEINLLTNYIYISLDTFHSVSQNISSYLDAWLMFLSSDDPEDIINLVEAYPEFKSCYHDISLFRKNPKELMNMYSEVLLEMDKNTANYMIEEMQKEVEEFKKLVAEQAAQLKKEKEISQKLLAEKDTLRAEKDSLRAEKDTSDARIAELEAQLAKQNRNYSVPS